MECLHVELVHQNSEIVLYVLWDQQSVKADVVTGLQMIDKTSCCVEYQLESVDQVCWQTGQYTSLP